MFLTAGRVSAADPPTLRGATFEPFSGEIVVTLKQSTPTVRWQTLTTTNIKPLLDDKWSKARGGLTNLLKQELSKPGRFSGQTLRNVEVNLGQRIELQAQGFGSVGLRLIVRGNRVGFNIGSPPFDPHFHIDFDLVFTVFAQLSLDAPTISSATVNVNASQPQPDNFVGGVVKGIADIAHFFGGPDLAAQVQNQINGMQFDVKGVLDNALNAVKPALAKLRLPNLNVRPLFDKPSQRLYLVLSQDPPTVLH
jgi:hypothetical protein